MDGPSDPLLRALADGDPACPDGRALVRLGALARAHATPAASDLAARVAGRLAEEDGDRLPPAIAGLLLAAAPRPADLRARVRERLRRGDDGPAAGAEDGGGARLRWWSAVAAAHLAALLLIAIWRLDPAVPPASTIPPAAGADLLPRPLPARWAAIAPAGDLLRLRRSAGARAQARRLWGMERSAGDVAAALRWLVQAQEADGAIGPGARGEQADGDQALAALALLGEGADDPARAQAQIRLLAWLAARPAASGPAAGLAALALVEGALLHGDAALRRHAEGLLAQDGAALVATAPGAAGHGAAGALAVLVADAGGLALPAGLAACAHTVLATPVPPGSDDPGRLGLALFAARIAGGGDPGLAERLTGLAPAASPDGAIDPLAWLFPTWALRECGGEAWRRWSAALQDALEPAFVREAGLAHIDPARVRHLGGRPDATVAATALAVLDLQAAYRWLPVAAAP